ncbi:hypothetical protein Q2941_39040 [Bradyrhizobium sp. UFLA05-153]
MDPEEYLYLLALLRWETTAPPDGHEALLDGTLAKNTQTARMVRVLRLLGLDDQGQKKLERNTQRKDGRSYISRDASWMNQPTELGEGWYFEGNMSLPDKKKILDDLSKLGLSTREFARCAQDFVEGKPVQKYAPSDEVAARKIAQWQKMDCG